MVAKLKTALVLLIIGSLSGLTIVGVHNLTSPVIEENRLRAQYEDYVSMFPDLADVEEESIDDDTSLTDKFTILDSDGNELGVIYRGEDTNDYGDVTVLVGIEDDTLKQVLISNHSNTPNYANIIIEDYLEPFSGQEVTDVSYDSSTGASSTYGSVQTIVEDAVADSQGGEPADPEKDAYATILEDADDYESYLKYAGFDFDNENTILDGDGETIAHGFLVSVEEEDVRLLFAPDTTFLGAVSTESEPSSAVTDLISDLDSVTDTPAGEIDPADVPDEFETAFSELSTFLPDYERLNDSRIKEETLLDDSDALTGYRYTVFKDGFSGTANEVAVEVDTDGEVTGTDIVNHEDTDDYVSGDVEPNLDYYDGYTLGDMDDADATDAFSGASGTGGSVVTAIETALELHDRQAKYAEIYDQMATVERTYVQGYDTLLRRIAVYDDSGSEVGVIYEGHDVNSQGPITVYAGITDGTIEKVTIPYHGNTPDYVGPLVEDHIDPLAGTDTDNISYDADTGATVTYESVQSVIDEAIDAENERTGE